MTTEDRPFASSLAAVTVGEAMRPGVITCPRDAAVPAIAATMVAHGIHAVILTRPGRGTPRIVTDFELVRIAQAPRDDVRASDLAHEPAATVAADATLEDAVEVMAIRSLAHLLVIDAASGD